MPLLICGIAGTGIGAIGGLCGTDVPSGNNAGIFPTASTGSTFAGTSCVGTGGGGFSYSTANNPTVITMPNETVTCTVTFNSTAVSAPVDSPLALSLVLLGIVAVAGFQRWRKRV
jgi:hypothetical protein